MILSIIVAKSENNVIGKDNMLPWHLPKELKLFKERTMGHPILMGRKTYESIGRPLPGRKNIVLTRQSNVEISGCEVAHSLDEALDICQKAGAVEAFVIGGAELIKDALNNCQKIYLTVVHAQLKGDTSLPELDDKQWLCTNSQKYEKDEKNAFDFTVFELVRK